MNITANKPKTIDINGVKLSSAAQALIFIAYGDSNKGEKAKIPFRCLDIKAECRDFSDFLECIKIIESYNEFNAAEMLPHLQKYLDLKMYYNAGNPNNGNSFFRFEIGREGSPAFYVSFIPRHQEEIMTDSGIEKYDVSDFKENMKLLKILLKAEEMDITEDYRVIARFWFD